MNYNIKEDEGHNLATTWVTFSDDTTVYFEINLEETTSDSDLIISKITDCVNKDNTVWNEDGTNILTKTITSLSDTQPTQ
ncbi:hypothetical protein N9N32_00485 [Alphaproteobacteria bacterium]|nr:hypothetical protein [Alphaproteobacteria bacterium]